MNADVLNPFAFFKEAIAKLGFAPRENKIPEKVDKTVNIPINTTVNIVYEEDGTFKQVENSICYVTDMYVILSGGATIPLNRIYKISEPGPSQLSKMLFI